MTTDRNSEGAVAWEVTDPRGNKTTRMGADRPNLTEPGWSARPLAYAGFRIVQVDFTPPASIPAAEVQALVERWQKEALELYIKARNATHDTPIVQIVEWREESKKLEGRADELARLIPRNPNASECLARAEAIAINSITGGGRRE